MATQAFDWHPTLTAIQTNLDENAGVVGGDKVSYYIGELDLLAEDCPFGMIWAGDSEFDIAQSGVDANDRQPYREKKRVFVYLATYQVERGTEDNVWSNAHKQMEDLQTLALNALSADRTVDGNVINTTILNIRTNPPGSPEDEDLQVRRIELELWKDWF